ncbi:MAG: phytanoyl-CoA dioxygenase [Candidatus Melainabacteria bacterium HGW-Melainabacteria-1]|nr:MAG: phytanoyl-CoA dioxygenase [Candidatus Melainabacteria bacterium HGW-Melainabacteria-1]
MPTTEPLINAERFWHKLQALGASSLAPEYAQALKTQGYVLIPDVIATDWCQALQQAFEQLWERSRAEGQPSKGTRHVTGWQEHAAQVIAPLLAHPLLLAAAWQTLARPFKLGQMHGREPLSGHGAQGLHADWGHDGDPRQFHLLNSLWLLDEFTPHNGATRVVPGSQVHRKLPHKAIGPTDSHPQQTLVTGPAGSLLIFNGHLWHSGTRNHSGAPRRAMQCAIVAAEFAHLCAPVQPSWVQEA